MQTVVTDDSWTAGLSAVIENDIYDGETIDARLASDAWLQPGFSDGSWTGARVLDFDTTKLVPYIGPILSGGVNSFEPTLTFHGFRYAQIEGWPGGIEALRQAQGALGSAVGSEGSAVGALGSAVGSEGSAVGSEGSAVGGMEADLILPNADPVVLGSGHHSRSLARINH